jgi:hypothetical protein
MNDKVERSGGQIYPITVCRDASAHFLDQPFSIIIPLVDCNIVGRMVAEINNQLCMCHWTANDESIHLIITLHPDTTILSFLHNGVLSLQDIRTTIRQLSGCWVEHNCDDDMLTLILLQCSRTISLPDRERWL